MTRVCCRLLVFSLFFLVPAFLQGQDAGAVRYGPVILVPGHSAPPSITSVLAFPANAVPPFGSVGFSAPYSFGAGTVSRPNFDLPRMVSSAGIIFSGYVTSVGRNTSPFAKNMGPTSITFHVEHGIRGTFPGTDLTIHEWAGLWARGERYRVGERVWLFLYPLSRLGLTSPVAGPVGRFAVDSRGRVVVDTEHLAALSGDPVIRDSLITEGSTGRRATLNYNDFARAIQLAGGME